MARFKFLLLVVAAVLCISATPEIKSKKYSAYLFAYFLGGGPGHEQVRYAVSTDALHWTALNNNEAILLSKDIASTEGIRDPHILRTNSGKMFYMVATDMNVSKNKWAPNHAMVLMKSADLINWTTTVVNIPAKFKEFADINRVWAPETIYDSQSKRYMVYWSMRTGEEPDKIYYSYANEDFTALTDTPKQLFFSPGNNACIDGHIIFNDDEYHLFFKTEGVEAGIKKATSKKINEGYVLHDKYLDQTEQAVEGVGLFKLNNSTSWIMMYDVYKNKRYEFTKSDDLMNFSVIDDKVTMDFHPRHGTVIPITQKEYDRLLARWPSK